MRIIPIFEDRLYSTQYDGENFDEFERLFDDWNDPIFLEEFFSTHESDLKRGFFGNISIEEAVNLTMQEAERLENTLLQLSSSEPDALDRIFRALHKTFRDDADFEKKKAYGGRHNSWLRIYAIKISGVFLVTGGAIKLTAAMGDREHTSKEITKMQRCLDHLKELGISDIDGFTELINE